MGNRAAKVTQTDLKRAIRAAEEAGGGYAVELLPDGVIRIVRAPEAAEKPANDPPPVIRL